MEHHVGYLYMQRGQHVRTADQLRTEKWNCTNLVRIRVHGHVELKYMSQYREGPSCLASSNAKVESDAMLQVGKRGEELGEETL